MVFPGGGFLEAISIPFDVLSNILAQHSIESAKQERTDQHIFPTL
jgi:hypothetical protein